MRGVSRNRVCAACAMASNGARYAEVAAVGGGSEVWKSTAKKAHARLRPVNSFIAEIEQYLNVHTGIRTRYLGLYCAWIAFRASVKGKDIAERVDELVRERNQTSASFRVEPDIRPASHPHFGKYFYFYLHFVSA